jgi:hypothetical protein
MMMHPLEVSILAAPLGAIDRRALSQAWYTALRLAPHERSAAGVRSPPRVPAPRPLQRWCCIASSARPTDARAMPLRPARVATRSVGPGDDGGAALRRRRIAAPLAKRIQYAFTNPSAQVRRATFSMGRGSVRIVVMLQTKGERAVLVAICPPEVSAVVSQALDEVRATLGARGIAVELKAKAARCS